MWDDNYSDNSENRHIYDFEENDSYSPHELRCSYVPQPKKTVGTGAMIAIIIAAVVLTAAAILVIFRLRSVNAQNRTAASLPDGEYGGELLSMDAVDGGWNVQVHIKGTPMIYDLTFGRWDHVGDTVYIYGEPFVIQEKDEGCLYFDDGSTLWRGGNGQWVLSEPSGKDAYRDLGVWTFFTPDSSTVQDYTKPSGGDISWPDTMDTEAVHFTLSGGEISDLEAADYF